MTGKRSLARSTTWPDSDPLAIGASARPGTVSLTSAPRGHSAVNCCSGPRQAEPEAPWCRSTRGSRKYAPQRLPARQPRVSPAVSLCGDFLTLGRLQRCRVCACKPPLHHRPLSLLEDEMINDPRAREGILPDVVEPALGLNTTDLGKSGSRHLDVLVGQADPRISIGDTFQSPMKRSMASLVRAMTILLTKRPASRRRDRLHYASIAELSQ